MPKLLSHPLTSWTSPSRPSPLLSSFIGFFDIKLGVTIISLLALLNKVAGIYGIMAVFTGVSLAQVTRNSSCRHTTQLALLTYCRPFDPQAINVHLQYPNYRSSNLRSPSNW